jgi:cold-inducible RNA-binding protein
MSKRLYVGNLSFDTSQQSIQDLFAEFGATSVTVISDHDGRSKGFGFVEVPDDQMQPAISALNGKQLGGRTLTVNEARAREPRTGGGGGGGGRW